MHKVLFLGVLMLCQTLLANAQELNVTVQVNAQKVSNVDRSTFDQMQQAIYDFMNTRKWTNDLFATEERIELNLVIQIDKALSADEFQGKMTVTYRRPVFGSSYSTTVFNHVDQDFYARYSPSIPMDFSETAHLQDLTSILGFYAYFVIGMDYDTFSRNGGTPYLQKALSIVNNAQSSGRKGWKSFEDNDRNRYWLVNNMLDAQFGPLRECLYNYHRLGLDKMSDNVQEGRTTVMQAVELLRKVHLRKPNSPNVQLFFTAKSDELVNIFQGSTPAEKNRIVNVLTQIDPANIQKYEKIKS